MISKNKAFLALTVFLSVISLLTGAASAQRHGANIKKHKKSVMKSGKSRKTVEEISLPADPDRRSRKLQGGSTGGSRRTGTNDLKASRKATAEDSREIVNNSPTESNLVRAGSLNNDLRSVAYKKPAFKEAPEREAPDADEVIEGDPVENFSAAPTAPSAVAPSPTASFAGLDFQNFGAGRPPDTNGDVGPTYFIQSVNSSIGIYRKSDGVRVVGLSLNTFMGQGHFGNLCDNNNFGDPVVLYDSFEDRWIITDFAFTLDASGNVTSNSFQCFAASKTGDPVAGGWNFYSTVDTDYLGDYPKFAVWNDGIYMTANMFGKSSTGSFATVRARALNKAQMYAGLPTVQVVTFDIGGGEFTILPANARLQTGTPPAGTPNLMSVVGLFTNAISVYKFKVDWNRISTSTVTGPFLTIAPASWSSAPSTVPALGSTSNRDTLATRLMVQNQYTNIGGVESLWNSHTVRGSTTTQSAIRYYQVNVTGGTVAAATTQAATHNPDTTNRYIPSLGVDKDGDMMLGYSASSATLYPAIRYAGRLAADPVNTITQTENSLIEGTGSEVSGTSTRWGDYSTMTLDPNGCTFWQTHEYYAATGGNWQTRIGSVSFPSCVALQNNGTLQGRVTSAATGLPISGAIVNFGSRTATTNAGGVYTFSNLPQGTYPAENAGATGYNSAGASNLAVSDNAATTQNFSLTVSPASACLTDTTQSDFQTGVPTNIDLTTSAGDAVLPSPILDQQNTAGTSTGTSFNAASWGGQTFIPAVTGPLTKVDVQLFCNGCTGTTPNLTLSIRSTSAGLPVGADLATTTITGFSNSSSVYYTATFSSPTTVISGTQYALILRPAANPSVGSGYFWIRASPSSYANGQRVTTADSGATWAADSTRDFNFKTYILGYQSSGTLTSSTKDSSPQAAGASVWTTLSWTASTPANTSVTFQAAGSNNPNGPFNFVGPDGTAGTFFTVTGASLSQFNGLRYLKYKAYLATTNSTVTPTLSDVTICFTNPSPNVWSGAVSSDWNNPANWTANSVPGLTDRAVIPASGIVNNPVNTTNNTVGTLQLDSGIIDTGANTLTVTTCSPSAVTGGSAASYVKSNLVRCVDNQGIYNFPVGTSAGYTPASLTNVFGSGNFAVTSLDGLLTGTSNTMSLQRNWKLTPSAGITQTDLTLNYLDSDVPAGADESAFQFVRRSGINDTSFAPSSINPAGNTATLNAVTSFSNWTLGTVVAPTAAGSSIAGKVVSSKGRAIANSIVTLKPANGVGNRSVRTNAFGNYRFDNVPSGQNYLLEVNSKGYTFQPKLISVTENLFAVNFIAK